MSIMSYHRYRLKETGAHFCRRQDFQNKQKVVFFLSIKRLSDPHSGRRNKKKKKAENNLQ